MKRLLTLTALLEAGAGLGLLVAPGLVAGILLGASLDLGGTAVGRVAGAALLALGVACWGASRDECSRAAAGLVTALLLYNTVVAGLLIYLRYVAGLSGLGLLPATGLHTAMAVWCIVCLRLPGTPLTADSSPRRR